MKKEKTVKTYQRRTKSGKVVTVHQHTAKYDAADKAAEASKKKGSGDELESLKKSKTMDTPAEISKDDFKEWYNFNEWDTPKKEWPESVKKVDSHLRKTMGKKGYDDYCAKIDESWSARGHLKAYKDFSSESKSKPKPLFTKKGVVSQVNEEPKKVNHIDKDFMDVYNNKIKKGTYDRMSDYKDQNDFRYKEVLKELKGRGYKIKEHSKWESPDGESYSLLDVTDPNGKKIASNAHSAAGSGHLLFLEKLAFGKQSKAVTRQKGTPVFDTKGGKSGNTPQGKETKANGSLTKNSITKALNNAGFKNDISSIKVDNDSVSIRLEGKAYGSGYSSYVEYNPSRPKSGYEVEGNPKRAEHVYEALRKLKGIDKLKSLVITESYD